MTSSQAERLIDAIHNLSLIMSIGSLSFATSMIGVVMAITYKKVIVTFWKEE